jgi:hypothetical protein
MDLVVIDVLSSSSPSFNEAFNFCFSIFFWFTVVGFVPAQIIKLLSRS